jgi:hypothetical protein
MIVRVVRGSKDDQERQFIGNFETTGELPAVGDIFLV